MTVDDSTSMTAKKPPLQKHELRDLIKLAAAGDQDAARRLISPFVSTGEKLVNFGISAKFGIIPTYDFFFVTDRQVGDLEITPLTGNLNVEVAYIKGISAFVLRQPAFSILLRLFMWSSYLWLPFGLFMVGFSLMGGLLDIIMGYVFGVAFAILGVFLAYAAVIPAMKRSYLHFKKSGLFLILHATAMGVLIFADRDKFEMISKISRQVSELKRRLDTESN